MAWYRIHPKRMKKQDLIGKRLGLDPRIPPEKVGGRLGNMQRLEVIDLDNTKRYTILVTELDVEDICEIYSKHTQFTFIEVKDEEFPKATKWSGSLDTSLQQQLSRKPT